MPMHAPVVLHHHRFLPHITQLTLVSDLCSAHFSVHLGVKAKPPETCSIDAVPKRAEPVASLLVSTMWPNCSEYNKSVWIRIPV